MKTIKNKSLASAYRSGFNAGYHDTGEPNPYRDIRNRHGEATWARVWIRYWDEGKRDGRLERDGKLRVSIDPKVWPGE